MRILVLIAAVLCAQPALAQQRPDPNEARPLTADDPPARTDFRPIQRMPAPNGGTALRVYREAERFTRPCTVADREGQQWCLINTEEFLRDYLRARAGDYQAQRNIAHMLGATRGGMLRDHYAGVTANPIEACAWRLVIITSGHPQAHTGDVTNVRMTCERLTGPERQAVLIRAEQITTAITEDPVRNPPRRGMPLVAR